MPRETAWARRQRAAGGKGRRRVTSISLLVILCILIGSGLLMLHFIGVGKQVPNEAPSASDFDFALLLDVGLVKVRLRRSAEHAARYVDELLSHPEVSGVVSIASTLSGILPDSSPGATADRQLSPALAALAPRPNETGPIDDGFRFYRAEPVPPTWGDESLPDSYFGGRWGPPYALLQGSLRPKSDLGAIEPAAADTGALARPPILRGDVAWAGGGGCCDFFIALDRHPEWGTAHTVFAHLDEESMRVVDAVLQKHDLRVENWGSINATVLSQALPFLLMSK